MTTDIFYLFICLFIFIYLLIFNVSKLNLYSTDVVRTTESLGKSNYNTASC